jgi:alpha-L-rhamnosidase
MPIRRHLSVLVVLFSTAALSAQTTFPDGHLDPTRNLTPASQPTHTPLPEEYLWTSNDITVLRPDHNKFPWNRPQLRTEPHFFRAHFSIVSLPPSATLYIAGPREAHVYLNGNLLADFTSNIDAPINFHVFHTDATHALKLGDNTLAIEAIRGRGVVSATDSLVTQQLAYGEVLAAKIIPAAFGTEDTPIIITDKNWRSTATRADHWQDSTFDDKAWPTASSLGPIEGNVDLFQWNADAGMYSWPGYIGMFPSLRNYSLQPENITHIYAAHSQLKNIISLTQAAASPFTITLPNTPVDAEAPSLLLDFGREVSGRLLVESACDCIATLSIAYGESEIEAMSTGLSPGQQGGNYLGTNILEVPAQGTARGPKSGFRYVRITFLRGAPLTSFKSIRLEGIYYPVNYAGSFESSDAQLNRIWETAAYTAHLCMQDGIWDAPKRDRGRWVGDIDITGRVISTAFADREQLEDTLRRLVPTGSGAVNGIPGYSALWITSFFDLYNRTGDKAFLAEQHEALLRILSHMDADLDPNGTFTNAKHQWLFVDWAPGLYGYTPEARIGTQLNYIRAYQSASILLRELGDTANADRYHKQSEQVLTAARTNLRDSNAATYGTTWQLNTLAIRAFEDDPKAANLIWTNVLSHVKQDAPTDQVISPYFNAYLLDAMSAIGHRREALDWLRQYWEGMLAEGATSFWESYDLRWPKANPHLSLQADGTSGYFVSMAHGWSAGPTAWLSENVLGISEPIAGYRSVVIAPRLLGLDWARGEVPTPHGRIKVSIDKQKGISLDLPNGIEHAVINIALDHTGQQVFVNGTATPSSTSPTNIDPNTSTSIFELNKGGHYEITVH